MSLKFKVKHNHLIIDFYYLYYQSIQDIYPEVSTSVVLYRLFSLLFQYVDRFSASSIYIIFDSDVSFRKSIDDSYSRNKEYIVSEDVLDGVLDIGSSMGICFLKTNSLDIVDIMYSISVNKVESLPGYTYIFISFDDLLPQVLLNSNTVCYDGNTVLYNSIFKSKYNFDPKLFYLFKSFFGSEFHNISGINVDLNIDTFLSILKDFSSVSSILDNLEFSDVSEKLKISILYNKAVLLKNESLFKPVFCDNFISYTNVKSFNSFNTFITDYKVPELLPLSHQYFTFSNSGYIFTGSSDCEW